MRRGSPFQHEVSHGREHILRRAQEKRAFRKKKHVKHLFSRHTGNQPVHNWEDDLRLANRESISTQ